MSSNIVLWNEAHSIIAEGEFDTNALVRNLQYKLDLDEQGSSYMDTEKLFDICESVIELDKKYRSISNKNTTAANCLQ